MHQIINQSDVGQSRSSNLNRDDSRPVLEMVNTEILHLDRGQQLQRNCSIAPLNLTAYKRFKLVLSLWKYTIPLFTVYAAEYMLQAGVWPAIGFPVTSASARARFYQFSNWTVSGFLFGLSVQLRVRYHLNCFTSQYQAGVFISRSSGNLCIASIPVLWVMPFLQVFNLYFFWLNSIHQFWYNYSLLLPCFFAGLLGGGVYVSSHLFLPMRLFDESILDLMCV